MTMQFNPNHPSMTFTAAAEQYLKGYLEKQKQAIGLCFYTKTTGCSGLSYQLDLIHELSESISFVSSNIDLPIFIKNEAIPYLNHLKVDFCKKTLGQSELVYTNPNETARCGCGESFSITKNKNEN